MITNPQVVKFVNEQLRPACDRAVSAIRTLRQLKANYAADALGPLVAGTTQLQQDAVGDGAAIDGRTVLLGYDVDNGVSQAGALLALLDANPAIEAALTKPGVNTLPAF